MGAGDRHFDRLLFEITAFPEADWNRLRNEYEGPLGFRSAGFDLEAHKRKRDEAMIRFTREFWFDITSFYGK
jgi:hypothetical protein